LRHRGTLALLVAGRARGHDRDGRNGHRGADRQVAEDAAYRCEHPREAERRPVPAGEVRVEADPFYIMDPDETNTTEIEHTAVTVDANETKDGVTVTSTR
jgi:hypothetical protein